MSRSTSTGTHQVSKGQGQVALTRSDLLGPDTLAEYTPSDLGIHAHDIVLGQGQGQDQRPHPVLLPSSWPPGGVVGESQ